MTSNVTYSDYSIGHPWYYFLGGKPLMPSEIAKSIKAEGFRGYRADEFDKIDKMKEPDRSIKLRKIKKGVLEDFWNLISCYRKRVRELREYNRMTVRDPNQRACDDVHVNLSLRYCHLCHSFAHLSQLDDLLSQQLDLFDL